MVDRSDATNLQQAASAGAEVVSRQIVEGTERGS